MCTGGDLQKLDEDLLETCESVCLQNPMCVAFVHYPVVPYVCWLKQTCDENSLSVVSGENTFIRNDGLFVFSLMLVLVMLVISALSNGLDLDI